MNTNKTGEFKWAATCTSIKVSGNQEGFKASFKGTEGWIRSVSDMSCMCFDSGDGKQTWTQSTCIEADHKCDAL